MVSAAGIASSDAAATRSAIDELIDRCTSAMRRPWPLWKSIGGHGFRNRIDHQCL